MKKILIENINVGKIIEGIGLLLFVATFWINAGIVVGGDPYFWGHFIPTAEVLFPLSGVAVLLIWIGNWIQHTLRCISLNEMIFWGVFYVLSIGLILLSDYTSLVWPWILIWSLGWFVMHLRNSFFPNDGLKQGIWFGAISIGSIICYWIPELFPSIEISKDIVGMAAVCGIFFSSQFGNSRVRKLFLHLFYAYIALKTENTGIIIAAGIALFNVQKYLPRMKFRALVFWSPMVFWGGGFGLLLAQGLNWSIGAWFKFVGAFIGKTQWLLFGAGEGQFLQVMDRFSAKILNPSDLLFPPSGALITFFEQGILGILIFVGLFTYQKLFWTKDEQTILPYLFFCVWFFSPDLVLLETGIVFLLAMLSVKNHQ